METKELLSKVEHLSSSINYWFVRTMTGDFYEDFKVNSFISIGVDEITYEDILRSYNRNLDENDRHKELGMMIKQKTTRTKYDYWAKMLIRFVYEIKKNDIVVVPDYSSKRFSIGKVIETQIFQQSEYNSNVKISCDFYKRKRVEWLGEFSREQLGGRIYEMIHARHAINKIDEYKTLFNSKIHDFYFEDDIANLVINVGITDDINAFELEEFYSLLTGFLKDFAEFEKLKVDNEKVSVKLHLQSPGLIIFTGTLVIGILLLGSLIVFSGGEFDAGIDPVTGKFRFKGKANSLLEKINEYQNSRIDRAERIVKLRRLQEVLKIKTIQDIEKLIKQNNEESNDSENEVDDPNED